ncbi:hypothetical protein FSP39_004020 [Pinctada imbricata]|uniref:Uncharacterized protein n=1 Tax=Pinctada imbricata TaxID=66713 RepID=A0AA88XQB0_PINIB|nr:hypothetical protein FSP39_004020 [Pinctada imbricata]
MHKKEKRCLVVGDAMVGKTTLIKTLLGIPTSERYESTVFLDFYKGRVKVPRTRESAISDVVRLPVENDDQIIIVCYSATDRESYINARTFWLPLIKKNHKRNPILIVATNTESIDSTDSEHVESKDGLSTAKLFNVQSFCEFSKTNSPDITGILDFITMSFCYNHDKQKICQR